MKHRKILKIVLGLLTIFVVAVVWTSIKHPIILKWLTGSAKHHGKPIPATVYTNGRVNNQIKVFYTDEANFYLLSLAEYDSLGMLKYINIDLNEKWIGRPVGTSKNNYYFIAGHLFQSETGGNFSPFQDMKDFKFDPQLILIDKQIKFNMPPRQSKHDSVRIILP